MWTALAIVLSSVMNDFPGVNDIYGPVLIQTFIPKAVVKALSKSVLRWVGRLDTMLKGSLTQRAVGKFRFHRSSRALRQPGQSGMRVT